MRTKNIVGASNLPFATADTQAVAEVEHKICFVPEGITSAGAVIVDSVEQFDNDAFANAEPDELYAFCRQVPAPLASSCFRVGFSNTMRCCCLWCGWLLIFGACSLVLVSLLSLPRSPACLVLSPPLPQQQTN